MRIRFREKTAFEAARCMESSGELHNPGQGWYHVYTFRAKPDGGRPVEEEAWLDESCRQEQLALVLILIGDYRACEIPKEALLHIGQILEFFRRNGKEMILRFVYDNEGKGMEREPLTVSMVKRHMEQIGGAIRPYMEDILVLQGIFVGNWGEMHGSKFLGRDSMCDLMNTLYRATEGRCFLAVRTPAQWRTVADGSAEPGLEERLGLYNDGIFGSETDLGTYGTRTRAQAGETGSWSRGEELDWQEGCMDMTPNGGEILSGQPLTGYRQAAEVLGKMHASYLNSIYHPDQLEHWRRETVEEAGCWDGISGYDYIGRHLGYRFTVRNVTEKKGKELLVTVENTGFGNLCQEAECFLVTEYGDGRAVLRHLAADPGEWRSGQESLLRADISEGRAPGSRLFLTLKRRADGRVIRFANEGAGDRILLGGYPDR